MSFCVVMIVSVRLLEVKGRECFDFKLRLKVRTKAVVQLSMHYVGPAG